MHHSRKPLMISALIGLSSLLATSSMSKREEVSYGDQDSQLGLSKAGSVKREANLTDAEYKTTVKAANDFSLNLFKLLANSPGNLVISPQSARNVLALTQLGARNETASEMARVLGLTGSDLDTVHRLVSALSSDTSAIKQRSYIFTSGKYGLSESFLRSMNDFYQAAYGQLDMGEKSALDKLNQLIAKETGGAIEKAFSELDPNTMLLLLDIIDLKAKWKWPFPADRTETDTFYSSDGPVPAQFMTLEGSFLYRETDAHLELRLPYKDDGLEMILIQPREVSLQDLVARLNLEKLLENNYALTSTNLGLRLPKFKLRSDLILSENLKALGMRLAFDQLQADFSGMTGARDLMISVIKQAATISVDEEGTEASAATAVSMVTRGGPSQWVELNSPFLFVITKNTAGGKHVLFMGRVENPTP